MTILVEFLKQIIRSYLLIIADTRTTTPLTLQCAENVIKQNGVYKAIYIFACHTQSHQELWKWATTVSSDEDIP